MSRSFFKKLQSLRLRGSLLALVAVLLFSALLPLSSLFSRPANAKQVSLCSLVDNSKCSTALLISVKDYSGNEVNLQSVAPGIYALPAASDYYVRFADATGKKYTSSNKPQGGDEIFVYISTNEDFSGTPFSTSIATCPSTASSLKDCLGSVSPKLYFFNGNSKVDDQAISGGIQPNSLSALGLKAQVTKALGTGTADVKIHFSSDSNGNQTATVTETDEEGNETEETAEVEGDEIETEAESGNEVSASDVTCSKATAGLGWILCSLGELASTILKTLYEKFIMPALQIRPVLLDRDNGTYAVWATFRDIANILFVIYLLVVIMSQLTGIGIDNYGIKKSLPRLIVAAILVNVSYLICQLAVDVSNVIGSSLYNFLANIEISGYQDFVDKLQEGNPLTETPHDLMSNGVTYLIAGGFLTGAIWMNGGIFASALAAVVPILGALFGAAVSVIFMFAMLSFRNAVVVIGVALSPLAFVCYILPSTKKLYERWLAIMKGMIFLYPICSMAIGGGYLASRIILGSGGANSDVFIVVSAMVAEVAPFFAVPSLVRAAYKATGELGARLNGMSLMASRRAQFSFRRSQFAQDRQYEARVHAANNISRRRFMTSRRSRIAARNTVLSAEQERRAADFMDNDANFESTRSANEARDNLAFEHKARDNAAMNDAENVRALSIQSKIADEAQLAKNREYARQLGLSGTAPTGAQVQVNGANITAQTLQDATIQQAVIGQENQLRELPLNQRMTEARAGLLRNNDYIDMRKAQQDAAISNETTKMYEEMYSKMTSVDDLKAALGAALTDGNINKSERLSAVIKAMNSKGMKEDMLQHMFHGANPGSFSATINAGRASGATDEQKRLSGALVDALASSGVYTLQEYAKYIGKQPGTSGVVDLRSFASSNSTTSGASLASAFNDAKEDALAKMDRDEIKAINGLTSTLGSGNLGAWAGVSPEAWAKHAAGLTNGKDINAFRDAMRQCTNDQREQIAHSFTPESFTQANHDTRRAIFNPTYDERTHTYADPTRNAGGATNIAALYRPLVDQINNDDQLRSRFSANANIRTELGVNP